MKRSLSLAALGISFAASAPAEAALYVTLQYNSGPAVIAATSATNVVSFSGTFGSAGLDCNALAANCYSIAVVGIDGSAAATPDLISFVINASASASSLPGVLTVYVQQTGLTGYVGNMATNFSSVAPTGSAQKAELFSFLDLTQIATQTYSSGGSIDPVTSIDAVNQPTASTESLVYRYTFGQGAGAFGNGLSFTTSPVPEPAIWALMIVGFGMIGGTMRRKSTQHVSVAFA